VPLSNRPAARARQLANLSARPPAPPPGNQRARRHGGYAAVAVARLDAKVREVFDALALDAPLRDADDDLPAADAAMVRLAAEALCRLEDVSAHVRDHGIIDAKGRVRPAVELEGRLRREAADYLESLGMSPRSRARLGLDVARGFDLAQAMAADAELERREREAGVVDVEGAAGA
jgi:Phage terminase, small subunit